ncbi:MAG: DUF721 domain-containing protein [Thiobacillus sp.]|nr:DUF721 domain-containing protein [Thiobacillus sp.]
MSAASLADLLASQLPHSLAVGGPPPRSPPPAPARAPPPPRAGDRGAVASILRQQTDALMASLGKREIAVTAVRISVNPELLARYVHPVEKHGLPPAALDELAHLNTEIEDGPLKEALDQLLRHHRHD